MRALSTLKSTFGIEKFSVASIGKVLDANRETSKSKTNWQTVTLRNDNGEEIVINGLELVKQAIKDPELGKSVFAKLPAGVIKENELTITEDGEFKSEFNLGFANNKFVTGAVAGASEPTDEELLAQLKAARAAK